MVLTHCPQAYTLELALALTRLGRQHPWPQPLFAREETWLCGLAVHTTSPCPELWPVPVPYGLCPGCPHPAYWKSWSWRDGAYKPAHWLRSKGARRAVSLEDMGPQGVVGSSVRGRRHSVWGPQGLPQGEEYTAHAKALGQGWRHTWGKSSLAGKGGCQGGPGGLQWGENQDPPSLTLRV